MNRPGTHITTARFEETITIYYGSTLKCEHLDLLGKRQTVPYPEQSSVDYLLGTGQSSSHRGVIRSNLHYFKEYLQMLYKG